MGFGTVIAAMVSVAIILLASYVCSNGGFYMADRITNSVMEMQENENEILKTGIEITGYYTDGTNISLYLHNTGSTKIKDFDHMDVIVNYSNQSGNAKTRWIPHQEDAGNLINEWTVNKTFNPDLGSPDFVNPGIFDPDEKMKLQISLEDSLKNNSINWIMVATPNGAKASGYFNA